MSARAGLVLADTSVWVDWLRDGSAEVDDLLEADRLAVHADVVGELAMGEATSRYHQRMRPILLVTLLLGLGCFTGTSEAPGGMADRFGDASVRDASVRPAVCSAEANDFGELAATFQIVSGGLSGDPLGDQNGDMYVAILKNCSYFAYGQFDIFPDRVRTKTRELRSGRLGPQDAEQVAEAFRWGSWGEIPRYPGVPGFYDSTSYQWAGEGAQIHCQTPCDRDERSTYGEMVKRSREVIAALWKKGAPVPGGALRLRTFKLDDSQATDDREPVTWPASTPIEEFALSKTSPSYVGDVPGILVTNEADLLPLKALCDRFQAMGFLKRSDIPIRSAGWTKPYLEYALWLRDVCPCEDERGVLKQPE